MIRFSLFIRTQVNQKLMPPYVGISSAVSKMFKPAMVCREHSAELAKSLESLEDTILRLRRTPQVSLRVAAPGDTKIKQRLLLNSGLTLMLPRAQTWLSGNEPHPGGRKNGNKSFGGPGA
jgi:hypothetical protein